MDNSHKKHEKFLWIFVLFVAIFSSPLVAAMPRWVFGVFRGRRYAWIAAFVERRRRLYSQHPPAQWHLLYGISPDDT